MVHLKCSSVRDLTNGARGEKTRFDTVRRVEEARTREKEEKTRDRLRFESVQGTIDRRNH